MTSFDPERWAEVEPLLNEALDLAPGERESWLARLRLTAPELAQRVADLLARESGPRAAWLEGDAAGFFGAPPTLAGHVLGSYTLETQIGQGGMGSVWLAHRSDGRFEGRVAVKLLNLALVGRAGAQRFVQEGTVLARLNHPNIAKLLDAGISDSGQPYLVLEYVEGERLDDHAEHHGLDPRQRIALFLDVLKAVAAAHTSLVIHRDIKPSNVMVATDGTVKLLDFGIAKLVDQGRPADVGEALTETGARAFTPEYAAPEVMMGDAVSTATDIYSLGVMLYRLLSGRHPTGVTADTPVAFMQAAIETEPVPLSDAVTPRRLRKLYLGDLDNVLSKALKKKPEERYQTAAAFADDLTRYLTDQPVTARPDSWGYRSAKFIRRHRTALAAATIAALSLVGGTGFAIRQMTVAERQRDRAQDALRRSAASVSFETVLFRVLDQGGRSFTYQELLDRARVAVEQEYQGEPVSRMGLSIQFAQHYLRRGDPVTAQQILDRSRAIADSLGRPDWRARTRCELAASLTKGANPDSALGLIRTARGLIADLPDPEAGLLNACDKNAGDAWLLLGRADSAAPFFDRVAERFRAEGDTLTESYLIVLSDQARALYGAGRGRDARAAMLLILEQTGRGRSADPWTRIAAVLNSVIATTDLGEFVANRERLGPLLADSAGPDSLAAASPVLRYQYAAVLNVLGQVDSAKYWVDRALEREDDLGPILVVGAHLTAAEVAAARGDEAEFSRHAAAIERFGARLNTRARHETGYLRILGMKGDGQALATGIRTELDTLGFGVGRPRQDLLLNHLVVAAERLNDAGQFAAARGYATPAAELAAVDSLARTRSGTVGRALLAVARASWGLHDTAAARRALAAADQPLRSGLGPDHRLVKSAAALRDSVGR